MATKKPSVAQLAARKLFAQRAKAGTLTKKRKTTAKAKPVARKGAVRTATRAVSRTPQSFDIVHGTRTLARCPTQELAAEFAQLYADKHGVRLAVMGG